MTKNPLDTMTRIVIKHSVFLLEQGSYIRQFEGMVIKGWKLLQMPDRNTLIFENVENGRKATVNLMVGDSLQYGYEIESHISERPYCGGGLLKPSDFKIIDRFSEERWVLMPINLEIIVINIFSKY